MIVVDDLVDGVSVDLAGTVAIDRTRDIFDELTQPRLVIAGYGFPGGPAFGLRSHSATIPTIGAVSSSWPRPVQSCAMLVSDLNHFLDYLPDDAPAPARRLAQHLGNTVQAATAGDAGDPWMTALPCRRRPAHRPCAGRITIVRHQPPTPIQWRCSVCADEGVNSNWEDSPYDPRLTVVPGARR